MLGTLLQPELKETIANRRGDDLHEAVSVLDPATVVLEAGVIEWALDADNRFRAYSLKE